MASSMRVISKDEAFQLYPMKDAVEATEAAFLAYSRGGCETPLRTCLQVGDHGSTLFMPASTGDSVGVKIVSVRGKNRERGLPTVPALYCDVDAATGAVSGLLDGVALTYLRTGAASGVAAKHLARENSKTVLIIGCGMQGRAALEAVKAARPSIEKVIFVDNTKEMRDSIASWASQKLGLPTVDGGSGFEAGTTAAAQADVIVTTTSSSVPVFDGKAVRKGALVSCVGAYLPDCREVDSHLITHSSVYVDTRNGALNEAGDLLIPIKEGVFSADRVIGEIGEVAAGKCRGRQSEDEVIVFKTVGSAVQDVVVGHEICLRAGQAGVGTVISM